MFINNCEGSEDVLKDVQKKKKNSYYDMRNKHE